MSTPQRHPSTGRMRPYGTWICMVLAVAATLYLLDWTGPAEPKPFVMLFFPAGLGIVGAVLAGRKGLTGWAVASALVGILLVPAVMFAMVIIGGP